MACGWVVADDCPLNPLWPSGYLLVTIVAGDSCRFSHDLAEGRASRPRHNDWSWNGQQRQSGHWAARPGAANGIWDGGYGAGTRAGY